jgi:putative Holliday junction resolvase
MAAQRNFLCLDVGKVRIGVAMANSISKLPSPVTTLKNDPEFMTKLELLLEENQITDLVIGLPRSLEDKETEQTLWVKDFSESIRNRVSVPVYFENEALSSARAEEELDSIGRTYRKEDIDSLAACFILDDFIKNNPEI